MAADLSTSYPAHRAVDVVLRDGSTARVRPVRPEDREAIGEFLEGLSLDSRTLRFFGAGVNLGWAARWATDIDYVNSYGIVVTSGAGEQIVGHAAYARVDHQSAEVAFEIADGHQGKGLGTILLAHLAEAAVEADIPIFMARVLPENHRMLQVFRESGFPVEVRSTPDGIEVTAPTSATPEAIERFELRDSLAARAALAHVLEPASVAVIGASRRRGNVGGEVFHNLISSGFQGPVYPVNPAADFVQSVPAYHSLADVLGDVELAVIAVPGGADLLHTTAPSGDQLLLLLPFPFIVWGADELRRWRVRRRAATP